MDYKSLTFPVNVFSLEKYSDTISKGRCRIFYKGRNRNGGFISEEFATQLIATLPYTPVKGIYFEEIGDYGDHGKQPSQGQIYGIVPENPNVSWEDHLDDDGMTRRYATCDVLVFTALYEEAKEVFSKGQSMELYLPSLQGEWRYINNEKLFYYTGGSFLSLQILGDDVPPCFEGAAFFSLKDALNTINYYSLKLDEINKGGQDQMKINSHYSEVLEELMAQQNPNFSAEGGWVLDKGIFQLDEDTFLVGDYSTNTFAKVKKKKEEDVPADKEDPEKKDSEEGKEAPEKKDLEEKENEEDRKKKKKPVFELDSEANILVVSKEEFDSLNLAKEANGGSFSAIDNTFNLVNTLTTDKENLTEQISEFESKKVEFENTISTLTMERDTGLDKYADLEKEYNSLKEELATLKEYKANVEAKEKEGLLSTYEEKLDKETIEKFQNEMSKYSYEELEKELAFSLVKNTPSLFSHENEKGYIPKEQEKSGIEEILSRYK